MKQLVILLFLFCSVSLFAQGKLAIINDSDDYVNVRKGKGTNYEIITTINKDEFFYCDTATIKNKWIKITALQWHNLEQVEGYVLRSRVQLVEKLDYKKQKELIIQVLNKHEQLKYEYRYNGAFRKEKYDYIKTKYDHIIEFLPIYFCYTQDTIIIQLFYKHMDWGSVDDNPSVAIGKCYVCYPDLVLNQVKFLEEYFKESIFDKIEWGLLFYFFGNDDENDDDEYNNLKTKLDNERKK